MFEKHGVKAPLFQNGLSIKWFPELHKEFHRLGHELSGRSYDQSVNMAMFRTREEERGDIRRSTQAVADLVGEKPVGWIGAAAKFTDKTQELLTEEGYLWHADIRDDDLPYAIRIKGKTLICIPHRSETITDRTWWWSERGRPFTPNEGFDHFREYFEACLETAQETGEALLVTWGIHTQIGAYPDRIRGVDKMLAYMKSLQGAIWMARFRDVAEFWRGNYA